MDYDVRSLINVGSRTLLFTFQKCQNWQQQRDTIVACWNNKHICSALRYINKGEDRKALKQVHLALKDNSCNPYAYDALAYLYLQNNNNRQALYAMERSIALFGDNVPPSSYLHLSLIYRELGYTNAWYSYAVKASNMMPDYKEALAEISYYNIYKERASQEDAEDERAEATHLRKLYMKTHNVSCLADEALCWFKLGNYERSLEILNLVQIMNPVYQELPWIAKDKAFSYEMLAKHDKATEEYLAIINNPYINETFDELLLALFLLYGESALCEPISRFRKGIRSKKTILELLDEQIEREQQTLDQLSGDIRTMWSYRLTRAAIRCRINRIDDALDDVSWMLEHTHAATSYLDHCYELLPLRESGEYDRLLKMFR